MEIKEQDLFANNDLEEVLLAEPSQVQVTDPPVQEQTPEPTVVSQQILESAPTEVQEVVAPTPEQIQIPEQAAESVKEIKPKHERIIWQLFSTFFKIGVVTFGGGYAMIPMIESEVVDKKKWVEKEQFLDLIAIAQTCPGVFAINISTFIGYKLRHNYGACMAAFGAALPSFIIILLIATMFSQIQDVPWVAACFRGIRPAVVALIAVPTFNLAKSAKINLNTCWIPIISALLIWALHVNPVFIIIAAALGGYLYGTLIKEK